MNIYQFALGYFLACLVASGFSWVAYRGYREGTLDYSFNDQIAFVMSLLCWASIAVAAIKHFYFWLGAL
jgi:hypothetical protein